jgi:hypothetical protein
VIDEVQKLPVLLDDVHALLSEHPRRYTLAWKTTQTTSGSASGWRAPLQ